MSHLQETEEQTFFAKFNTVPFLAIKNHIIQKM